MKYTLKQKFETHNEPFVVEPDGFGSIEFIAVGNLTVNGIGFSLSLGHKASFILEPYVTNSTTYYVSVDKYPVSVIKYYYTEV